MQVGNGDFAFGADITSLQTFLPYNTLTSWCWHNSSLPTTPNQTSPSNFTGLDWWTPPLRTEGTQGRLVNYEMPNPTEADISQWMIANPHRVNVGRIGLWFGGSNVTEIGLVGARQELDLYSGVLKSEFEVLGETVVVTVVADPDSSTVGVRLESVLLQAGRLGVFWDFPYASGKSKFEDPFVGIWNATENHTTTLLQMQEAHRGHGAGQGAAIRHEMDATTYYTSIHWSGNASLTRETPFTHRYLLQTAGSSVLDFTTSYLSTYQLPQDNQTTFSTIQRASSTWWCDYWETGAFVDLTKTGSNRSAAAKATELQRRIILSRYLLAINGAGVNPPQESGLTNNGWYGKFHAEMFFWHLGHWARWSKWSFFSRSMPNTYVEFLSSSKERAARQGYKGARWGKMSDPSGRSAPGEINSLLIWQQPHVFQFAEYEWRAFPTPETLEKWEGVLWESAEFHGRLRFVERKHRSL